MTRLWIAGTSLALILDWSAWASAQTTSGIASVSVYTIRLG